MIVSHEYRYVFLQLPHCGSTAIGRELCAYYGGVDILSKHSNYLEFLRIASAEQRHYFAFSTIRHPLDEAVTRYFRYKTNQRESFTDPAWLVENGGWVTGQDLEMYRWVQAESVEFPTFARRYYRLPYDNWSCLSHHQLNYVIRFESLAEGFAEALARLGLKQGRPLPVVNRTPEKEGDFFAMYPPELRPWAVRIFAPFMHEWGYEFPPQWEATALTPAARLEYQTLKLCRRMYWGRLSTSPRGWLRGASDRAKAVLRAVYLRTGRAD
jgi:hypothetical protein